MLKLESAQVDVKFSGSFCIVEMEYTGDGFRWAWF